MLLCVVDNVYTDTVNVPQVPYGWKDMTCKQNKRDPLFNNLYNPEGWSIYNLFPYFIKIIASYI